MTDKEQALVAAAYRAAANAICPERRAKWSKKLQPMADANRAVSEVNRDVILNLSASDAEAKLRELMMGVAITMMNNMYGERVWIEDPLRQIVDEVLNATK